MKTLLIYTLAAVVACAACTLEKDPFAGTDHYIASFTLQQGEATFEAAITGDLITVTAPEGFSLNLATATVKLSERATIYPDPAGITDWESEYQFVVTARDGSRAAYTYTVVRSGLAHAGAVRLYTQEDVDAFGERGITYLDGELTIGRPTGTDTIHSLAPLASLREVAYGIVVNPTCAITDMDGLHELRRVGGIIQVGALPRLETFSLPGLQAAGGITLKTTVTYVIDFPRLERLTRQSSFSCPLWQINLPALRSAGDLTITTASGSGAALTGITLPALEQAGVLIFSSFADLFEVRLPALVTATEFRCSSLASLAFIYLPRLQELPGQLYLYTLASLTELDLPALERVGTFTITSAAALRVLETPRLVRADAFNFNTTSVSLSHFPALQTVGKVTLYKATTTGKFSLPPALQRIDHLSIEARLDTEVPDEIDLRGTASVGGLEVRAYALRVGKILANDDFGGSLIFNYSSAPTSPYPSIPPMEGFAEIDSLYCSSAGVVRLAFPGIRKVKRGVYHSGSTTTTSFSLPDLEEVGGNLLFQIGGTASSTLSAVVTLEKLRSVGGNLTLMVLSTSMQQMLLPELASVGGNLTLYSGRYGRSVDCPKLTSVGGKFTLTATNSTSYTNGYLVNLDGFSALTNVRAVEITRQAKLTSFEGLKGAFPLAAATNWTVSGNSYNPTYQNLLDGIWVKP